MAVKYEDSFAYCFPKLLEEWHPTKNGDLNPADILPYSNRKVWWRFPYDDPGTGKHFDFEWEASIASRTGRAKAKCPFLSGRGVWPGFNDLKSLKPELVDEWDYENNCGLTPESFTVNSAKNVSWKCSKGHVYKAKICMRTLKKKSTGCPYCAGRLPILGETDLLSRFPELSAEWDYEKNGRKRPENYTCGSHQKVFWRCKKSHSWEASISSRVNGTGCPYCCGKKILKGFNDFASKYADKLSMWNYEKNLDVKPDETYYSSCKKVWWVCKEGHEWETTLYAISIGGGCPYCSSERLLKGFNDLETLYPQICELWDYELNELQPSDVFPKSAKRIHWKCNKGHKWDVSVHHVVNGGGSCPVCSQKRMAKGVNDFATVASKELIEEWNYDRNIIAPDEISAHNSKIKVWWKCKKCGGEWELSVAKRIDRGDGCPYCSGKRVIKGKNDLVAVYPDIVNWWSSSNTKSPEEFFPYSHAMVKWICPTCGYEFNRIISHQVSAKTCPCCTDTALVVGKNDLRTRQPLLIEEWNYKRNKKGPEYYKEHSNEKVWWICSKCGYEWRAMINNRSKGRGCPMCNRIIR